MDVQHPACILDAPNEHGGSRSSLPFATEPRGKEVVAQPFELCADDLLGTVRLGEVEGHELVEGHSDRDGYARPVNDVRGRLALDVVGPLRDSRCCRCLDHLYY